MCPIAGNWATVIRLQSVDRQGFYAKKAPIYSVTKKENAGDSPRSKVSAEKPD
uniref:Uncharacterized protein n=1 Tax=Gloeothece verrucosa (strain PCC 7822) TaxID=497965 RepID=E0UM87_GLOV7|nr:hypothetical protein Cyan7822_6267 [Gloeothece verrucosa PCC 7822]